MDRRPHLRAHRPVLKRGFARGLRDPEQLILYVTRALPAFFGILVKSAASRVIQPQRGHRLDDVDRRWLFLQNRRGDTELALTLKGALDRKKAARGES
jgi:hypothetical protein